MTELAAMTRKIPFYRWCLQNPVEIVTAILTVLLTVVVFLQVVYRYALHSPLAWSEEFAMFLFQWCLFLGASVAVRHCRHFYVDLVISRLPDRWRIVTQILSSVIIFAVAYIMIHVGIRMVVSSMDHFYPVLQFPIGYGYLVFPISGTLMIIYQVPIFVRQIQSLTKG
jgi:TRAP-type C4-dicarboxylate transport system permease small subunit